MKRFIAILFAAAALAGCSDDNDTQQYDYLTFENVGAQYLAGPTSKGENLYGDYAGDQYKGYSDAATGLRMEVIHDPNMNYDFWNGGIVISQWNEMTTNGYNNQCSVYHNAVNGNGGHGGSKTFAVVYCTRWAGKNAALFFENQETERIFDHFWVTNSTYTALAMIEGSYGEKGFNHEDRDWLLLTIEGYDKAGVKKGEVPFYLADFLTADGGGIVTEWTKVDLSALGLVNRLEFKISGSDNNAYGLTTPSYFCFDDVAIRQ